MNTLKHSLRIRLAVVLVAITAGITMAGSFIYSTFLARYYAETKKDALTDIYDYMNDVFSYDEQTDMVITHENEIQKLRNRGYNFGIQILVVDTSYGVCFANVPSEDINDSENLLSRIKEIVFNADNSHHSINLLENNENYQMYSYKNLDTSKTYIEMWGELDCGYLFLMRLTNESISETADIANRFYLNVAFIMIVVGVLFMLLVANRISRPIRELASVSKKMSNLEFDAKYTGNSKDEVGILGENMNEMSEKLENTISELKAANNELKKDIEAKTEIDTMRKEFISNVSHELKTPIALIQGYAEGLKEGVNDDPDSREFYCDVIIDEAVKMNKMVRKLLNLNQIEFGNAQIEYERFDIVQTIDNILNQTRILLQEKNAIIDFDNEHAVYVWSDEYQIEEVFTNYISNAINHLGGDNIIKIKIEDKDGVVRVAVANTGQNIPPESMERIWDKFYKVDKARTREYGGSGIGLSIVKAIMESLHMKCGAENLENGVEFWFEMESGQDLKK